MLRRLSHLRFRQSIFHTASNEGAYHICYGPYPHQCWPECRAGAGTFNLDVLHRMTFSASWSRFFKEVGVTRCRVVQSAPWRKISRRQTDVPDVIPPTRRDKPGRCGCLPAITMLAPPLLNQPISIMIPWERYKYSFPSPVTGGNSHWRPSTRIRMDILA